LPCRLEIAGEQISGQSYGKTLALFAKSSRQKEGNGDSPIYASRGIASLRIEAGGLAAVHRTYVASALPSSAATFHASPSRDTGIDSGVSSLSL
jgi:hypothetical protein